MLKEDFLLILEYYYFLNLKFNMYVCVACMLVYVPHVCLFLTETRRGYQTPWNWCYK